MILRLSGGRRLQSPLGDKARPTTARVRLAVMNILAPRMSGCRWLDLCCGSGVMACEALQRGASQLVAVEQDRRIAQVARTNLASVAATHPECAWQVHCRDVLAWLKSNNPAGLSAAQGGDLAKGSDLAQGFDLIYLDPPYASGLYAPVAKALAEHHWLAPGGLLLWECASASPPAVPQGWTLEQQRRYGTTTLMLLSRRAGCPGDTGSRRP